jgi:protein-tyrosine phosphatase
VSTGDATEVLFVCTGNICRSPIAELVAARRSDPAAARSFVSAGTAAWHEGEPMDPRAAAVLAEIGIDPTPHRAQHASDRLLATADVVVALDRKHAQILKGRLPEDRHGDLVLLRSFDPQGGGHVDVHDPYYGDQAAFATCLSVVSRAVDGLLVWLDAGRPSR